METIRLESMRGSLIRQEETIIFALIERAQFKRNLPIYEPGAIPLPDFDGSFADYLLHETECVHARVRRYTSPDEHPFTLNLPAPILPSMTFPERLKVNAINLNHEILAIYRSQIVPLICGPGDCGNYGSSAVCDVTVLQALSKRIHAGKYVAEAKFQSNVPLYTALIRDRDRDGIRTALRDEAVEAKLLKRVAKKAETYGQEIDVDDRPAKVDVKGNGASRLDTSSFKILPDTVADLYRDIIIPLTIEVEIIYLLERLDP